MDRAVNFATRHLVDRIGALLWPPRCLLCGAPGADGLDLCASCATALPWHHHACTLCAIPLPASGADPGFAPICGACLRQRPPLDATRAAFAYRFPLDRLLPRLKFHQGLPAARLLAVLCARALAAQPRL